MPTLQEQVGTQAYNPYQAPHPWEAIDRAQRKEGKVEAFPGGAAYSPYGFSQHPEVIGDQVLFGGPRDMAKSSATRSLAIQGIKSQMEQEATPQGLQSALSNYASQNPYLASLQQNYAPNIDTQSLVQQQQNLGQLRQLMEGAYVLGGGIYGSAMAAWAEAKAAKKAKDKAKTQRLQAIVGGAMKGLGLNQYGEADTTQGMIGGLEL